MSYKPFADQPERELVDTTWAHLQAVQKVRLRSRVVSDEEKEMVCDSYGWEAEEVCTDDLTLQETACQLAAALFEGVTETPMDTLRPGEVFDAMRSFLSQAQGGEENGDDAATALSQVLNALNGQTTANTTKAQ